MAVKSGIPLLIELGIRMCDLIFRFTPIIVAISNDDENVINALNGANAACAVLVQVLQPLRSFGD